MLTQDNRAVEYITVERHDPTTQGSSLLATASRVVMITHSVPWYEPTEKKSFHHRDTEGTEQTAECIVSLFNDDVVR